MSACHLRALAQSINECTTLLSESWHDNDNHDLSTCATQGSKASSLDSVAEKSRNRLISSLRQLERLVLGPKDTLQNMYFKSAETGVIHALCNLKVPHNVPATGSISYTELATKLNVNQDRLTHLIRNAIICSDFLAETSHGEVKHSALSSLWHEDPVMAAGNEVMLDNLPLAAFNIAENIKRDPADLDDSICPFSVYRNDTALFQWFEQNPEQGRKFAAHMRAQSSKAGDGAVRDGYEWNKLADKTLVDCGGSFGSVGAAILSKEPSLKIVVQDLPKVIESAKAAATAPKSTIPASLTFAAHSFLEPQPTIADVYLYRMVFHNWSDAGARRILRALMPALRHGTRVILIEYVMPSMGDKTVPDYAQLQTRRLDNTMYSLMNGKVRELDEFKALFQEVEPRLRFDSYKAGQYKATHDPRSHSIMSWVFEDPDELKAIQQVKEDVMGTAEFQTPEEVTTADVVSIQPASTNIEPSTAELLAKANIIPDQDLRVKVNSQITETEVSEPSSPSSTKSSGSSEVLSPAPVAEGESPVYTLLDQTRIINKGHSVVSEVEVRQSEL